MAHPMIEMLNEEMQWTNQMYLATGKNLGVTIYDVNKKNEIFQHELEAANRINLDGDVTTSVTTSFGSDLSFN